MDGKIVPSKDAKVHILTHTLHYGGGVFEGIRFYNVKRGAAAGELRLERGDSGVHAQAAGGPCRGGIGVVEIGSTFEPAVRRAGEGVTMGKCAVVSCRLASLLIACAAASLASIASSAEITVERSDGGAQR